MSRVEWLSDNFFALSDSVIETTRKVGRGFVESEKQRQAIEVIDRVFPRRRGWRKEWTRTEQANIIHLANTNFGDYDFIDIYVYLYFLGRFGCFIQATRGGSVGFHVSESDIDMRRLESILKSFVRDAREEDGTRKELP